MELPVFNIRNSVNTIYSKLSNLLSSIKDSGYDFEMNDLDDEEDFDDFKDSANYLENLKRNHSCIKYVEIEMNDNDAKRTKQSNSNIESESLKSYILANETQNEISSSFTNSSISSAPTTSSDSISLSELKLQELKLIFAELANQQQNNIYNNIKQCIEFDLARTISYPIILKDLNKYSFMNSNKTDDIKLLKQIRERTNSTISRYSILSTSQDIDEEIELDFENYSSSQINQSICDRCLKLLEEIERLNKDLENLSKSNEKSSTYSPTPVLTNFTIFINHTEQNGEKKTNTKTKSILDFVKKLNPFN